jgi:hypothetical protein
MLSFPGDSLLMLILVLGVGTMWKWAVLPTIRKKKLPPSSIINANDKNVLNYTTTPLYSFMTWFLLIEIA